MKKIILGAIFTVLIFPQITLAAWWNPTTWFSSWFSRGSNTVIEGTIAPDVEVQPQVFKNTGEQTLKPETKPVPSKIPPATSIKPVISKPTSQVPPVPNIDVAKKSALIISDNINSGVVDEKTQVTIGVTYKGKIDAEQNIGFKIYRNGDVRALSIETPVNFKYFLDNGGVYKADLSRVLGPMTYGQTATTTYYIEAFVQKLVTTPVEERTVSMKQVVSDTARTRTFKISIPPVPAPSITFTVPTNKTVFEIGKSYPITWSGTVADVATYGVYLKAEANPSGPAIYLGSVGSSEHAFTIKVAQTFSPGVYHIEFKNKTVIIATSPLFKIDTDLAGQEKKYQDDVIEARMRDARVRAELYYDKTGSYAGFCNQDTDGKVYIQCTDSSDAYVVQAKLSTGLYACIDSVGNIDKISKTASGMACKK